MHKILIIVSAFLAFQNAVGLTLALNLLAQPSFDLAKAVQVPGTDVKLEFISSGKNMALLYIVGSDGLEGVIDLNEKLPITVDDFYSDKYYITPFIHLISDSLDNYTIQIKNNVPGEYLSLEIEEAPGTDNKIILYAEQTNGFDAEYDVFLDGVFYGKTPKLSNSWGIEIGRFSPHIVTMAGEGYCEWNRIATKAASPKMVKTFLCKDEPANILMIVDQINPDVYVNGVFSENSRDNLIILKKLGGNHTVRLYKKGFETWEQKIEINPGSVKIIEAHLSSISDSDSDGVPDSQDSCKNTPLGKPVNSNGCAKSQLDSDGDGVTDDVDQCPTQAETLNEYQDSDGCPDVKPPQDKDGDGIVDENDSCPNEPENFNNYQDTDGCPDVVPTISSTPTTPSSISPTPATKPEEKSEITSPEDIQTTVKERITSTERLLVNLIELVSTGKKIGADVSIAEDKINSARLILSEANASYTLAIQKFREGDPISTLNQGNNAYIKGTSGMTMLDEAKPPLYSAIRKRLSDDMTSTESLVNFAKIMGIGASAQEKLRLANIEIAAVDSSFRIDSLPSAKAHVLNADDLLGQARMSVYSLLGVISILAFAFVGLFLRLRAIPPRPKARMMKGGEARVAEARVAGEKEPLASTAKGISVVGLSKSYKKSVILENVVFEINQGTLCGIVGSSGGGKSTLIEGIAGRTPPDKGEIKILGIDTKKDRMRINQLVGFVPQHPELYLDQTVWQNMMNSALKWSVKDAEAKSEKILKQLDIFGRKDVIAKNLSGGQLKRLSLGMELIREPPILVLDEPTTGLDPTSRDQILTALSKVVTSEKRTAVFTTHFMDEAEHCDEVMIVGNAQILAKGPPSELARKMPGGGKVVNITLEEVSENLVSKVSALEGVRKVIREGRVLKMIMDYPDPVTVSQKVKEFGGVVEEAKIAKAGMKEVFVYYTGVYPEDVR